MMKYENECRICKYWAFEDFEYDENRIPKIIGYCQLWDDFMLSNDICNGFENIIGEEIWNLNKKQ